MFVKAYLPDVHAIFSSNSGFNLGADYYASPWLLTFFSVLQPQQKASTRQKSSFDLYFVLSAIDLFLLEGVIGLIRICLGILSAIKGKSHHPNKFIFRRSL